MPVTEETLKANMIRASVPSLCFVLFVLPSMTPDVKFQTQDPGLTCYAANSP